MGGSTAADSGHEERWMKEMADRSSMLQCLVHGDVDTAPQEKSRENGNVYSIEVQQNTTVRPNLSVNWNWKTARI